MLVPPHTAASLLPSAEAATDFQGQINDLFVAQVAPKLVEV